MATEKKTSSKSEKPAKAAPKKAKSAVSAEPKAAAPADIRNGLQRRKEAVGVVVSDKMQKTIVVKVDRRVRHSLYKKYVMKSRRFKAHDEKNEAKVGDLVTIVECRPLSRDKRWALQRIVRRAEVTLEANV